MKRLVTLFLVVGSLSSLAQGPRDECPAGRRGAQCRAQRQRQQQQRAAEQPVVAAKKETEVTQETLLRPTSNRIDFEGSNLTGQTNRAGGVYLYNRKDLAVRTMIHKPDNFRSEIVSPD
ncbi:MAG: hypothetical protein QM817_11345 [Archangium sp.]